MDSKVRVRVSVGGCGRGCGLGVVVTVGMRVRAGVRAYVCVCARVVRTPDTRAAVTETFLPNISMHLRHDRARVPLRVDCDRKPGPDFVPYVDPAQ